MDTVSGSVLPDLADKSVSDVQFKKAAAIGGLSPDGVDWLNYSTDVFSDDTIVKARPPLGGTEKTVAYELPSYMEITKPASIPDGTKWGFHIVEMPYVGTFDFINATRAGNTIVPAPPGSVATTGNVYIQYFTDAAPLTFGNVPVDGMDAHTNFPDAVAAIPHRGITKGFELHSTAPQLVEQGDILPYRSPVNHSIGTFNVGPEAGVATTCHILACPPRTVDEAIRMTGAKPHKAKFGLLSQGFQERVNQELDMPDYFPVVLIHNLPVANEYVWYGTPTAGINAKPIKILDYMYNGAFVTGLGDDSSFRLVIKEAIEVCPGPNDTNFTPFAYDTPEFDERAIAVYKSIARCAPFGVKVSENSGGMWWQRMKDLAWQGIDALASVDVPLISTVARGAKFARGAYNMLTRDSKANTPSNSGDGGQFTQNLKSLSSTKTNKPKKKTNKVLAKSKNN